MNDQSPSNTRNNEQRSTPNFAVVIGLAFAGLFAGAIAGFIIDAVVGLLTRNIGGLFYFHVAMAALPYLGALIGAVALPMSYTLYARR